MQHIKNVLPTFYIIAETKINEDGVRGFFNKEKPSFFTSLEEKNKIKISDSEKVVETIGNICRIIPSEHMKNNKEYVLVVNDNFPSLLNHTHVTVAFNNVSQTFIDKLHRMHAKIEIHQRELEKEELKFWLLPTYEDNEKLAFRFAELFESYGTLKAKLEEELKNNSSRNIEKDLDSIKRLLPNTYALDAVVTANLSTWKEIIIKYTDFIYDDEIRYVLLFLAKAFKQKYANLMQKVVLIEKSGNNIGLDSLKIDGKIWRTSKIVEV
jgi:hypothetical protein